jgi:hypothetical protein
MRRWSPLIGLCVLLLLSAPARAHWWLHHHHGGVAFVPGMSYAPGVSFVPGASYAPGVSFVSGAAYVPGVSFAATPGVSYAPLGGVATVTTTPGVSFLPTTSATVATTSGFVYQPAGVAYVPVTTAFGSSSGVQAAVSPLDTLNAVLPLIDRILALRQQSGGYYGGGSGSMNARLSDIEDRLDNVESRLTRIERRLRIGGTGSGGSRPLPNRPPGPFSESTAEAGAPGLLDFADIPAASREVVDLLDQIEYAYVRAQRAFSRLPKEEQDKQKAAAENLARIKKFLEDHGRLK